MPDIKRSFRIEEQLLQDMEGIASERHATTTQVVSDALRLYRDYYYTQSKATVIGEESVKAIQATVNLLEQRLNQKTNSVLSELAIQQYILNCLVANGLEVNPLVLPEYRKQAVEYLRSNNAVFRLTQDALE